jgi:branched-chain amino acid transport system substrate-binding protein
MARLRRGEFLGNAAAFGAASLAMPAGAAGNYGDLPIAGTVTIGVVAPFTGDAIHLGEQLGNGVRAAIDDTNQLRGTLDKAFVLRPFDDQNLLATGLQSAEFACDDATIVCVIGHLSGKITDAALKTYVNNDMPVIVPATTYDPITSHGYGSVLRLSTKDSTEGRLTARSAEALKPANAVVLYQDGDYGLDVAAGFHNQLLADKVTSKALGFSWSAPDFAGVAKAALDSKPDVIYMAGVVKDMGGMIPALHAAGYTGPLYASQGFFDALTVSKYGAAAEGLIVSSSMPPLQLAPSDFRVRNNFQLKYGAMTPLSTFAYAAAQIAIAGVHRTGATDRIGVARSLSYATPFDTVLGSMTFQNDGDPSNPNVYFYTIKNGAWSYLRASHKTEFILK